MNEIEVEHSSEPGRRIIRGRNQERIHAGGEHGEEEAIVPASNRHRIKTQEQSLKEQSDFKGKRKAQ